MTATTNAENVPQNTMIYLIVEQILASSPSMVREVQNLPPNFKQIA